ncbi:MAG: RAMP superfamily CRISPR-associated protein [Nostoc sp.]|uniref:RAMP superfamily CRISPR-associated protein n=1 Tax=Nostoc sp. TaxID=1180 RepID=UPI002FF57626
MSLKDAFAKAYQQKGITVKISEAEDRSREFQPRSDVTPEEIRMMYRAQIKERCSLQNAGKNPHLIRWVDEWVQPSSDLSPTYQKLQPSLGLDGNMYRFLLKLPGRLSSNSGQDSIIRPVIDSEGIPMIPGSGIKGLFQHWLRRNKLTPTELEIAKKLRFHRAYPLDDWTAGGRIVDVIHPQQDRQVGIKITSPHAYAAITLYQPKLVFELSCRQQLILEQWQRVEEWMKSALVAGIGGKTSTGYGLIGQPPRPQQEYNLIIPLLGTGVSSLLRTDVPEFRPNQFKASIRGHVTRLLSGVCSDRSFIDKQLNYLFGHDRATGKSDMYWQTQAFLGKNQTQGHEKTPIFKMQGKLLVSLPQREANWLRSVFRFAYIMGGFGKSWRRVWHKCDLRDWHPGFMPSYQTRAIGCHWECSDLNFVGIKSKQDLEAFLSKLYRDTQQFPFQLNSKQPNNRQESPDYMNTWRETWHPNNVTVYALETDTSQAINLFHGKEIFKYTPAIGGRGIKIEDGKEKRDNRPTSVSSVWHRMLPIEGNKYLEIVTVFHGDRTPNSPWRHKTEGDQLKPFIERLEKAQLALTWGTRPTFNR